MSKKTPSRARAVRGASSSVDPPEIPEPFQMVGSSTVAAGDAEMKVPSLTLEGEWLRACGFPIGSAAYLTTDRRGEMALNRLGLGLPRYVRIIAAKPTAKPVKSRRKKR